MRSPWLGMFAGALGLAAPACMVSLEREVACGDGFVDVKAGEECDPADPSSVLEACAREYGVDGTAQCDPQTCQLNLDRCVPSCGNGVVESIIGEECDPSLEDLGSEPTEVGCTELDNDGPMEFAGGIATRCIPPGDPDECTWDRSDCHFCGDGVRQQTPFLEACDGRDILAADRVEFCTNRCLTPDIVPTPAAVHCQATCRDDCSGLQEAPDGLDCCLPGGLLAMPQIPCCNPPTATFPDVCGFSVEE